MEDALFAAKSGADALGFIFYTESPRYIDPLIAREIIEELPPHVIPVGVFVNMGKLRIGQTIAETGIREIQLSGDESPDDCKLYPVNVVKSFRISDTANVERIKHYTLSAAMLDGAGEGSYGGSGKLADFGIALEMKKYFPLILAGGLNPDNIADAINAVQPYGVDVNSGVEKEPGIKDHTKIEKLFKVLDR